MCLSGFEAAKEAVMVGGRTEVRAVGLKADGGVGYQAAEAPRIDGKERGWSHAGYRRVACHLHPEVAARGGRGENPAERRESERKRGEVRWRDDFRVKGCRNLAVMVVVRGCARQRLPGLDFGDKSK
ncbi:hypothetical protein ACET3Z_029723 [Daucus carota]